MAKYVEVLTRLGDTWNVPWDLMDDLDEFTCALYGKSRVQHVDVLRVLKINERYGKDNELSHSSIFYLATLPPCRRNLEQNIKRVNYQIVIWKRAFISQPAIPDASGGNGQEYINKKLEPLWYEGFVLPQQVTDITEMVITNSDEDDESENYGIPDDEEYIPGDSSESDHD